ncbi:MAG: DUF6463 family protein, partial [Thermomicrobiales bacterium]
MILDDILPTYQFSERHRVMVAAPPHQALEAAKQVTLAEIPLVGLLFDIRSLPERLFGGRGLPHARRRSLHEQMLASGFVSLGEDPDREVVIGLISELWKVRGGATANVRDADDFVAFAAPGYAKAAMHFLAIPAGDGAELITETRVLATDATARRQFGRYWRVIRPGSAIIRRILLRAAKRRAERGAVHSNEETRHYLIRFVRSNGSLLTAIGIAHIVLGLTEVGVLSDIAGAGVVNAVEPHDNREAWFWYMTAGWTFLLIGRLTIAIERRNEQLPAFLGWSVFVIGAFGAILMPVSGFWAILAVSALMLRAAYREPSAVSRQPSAVSHVMPSHCTSLS